MTELVKSLWGWRRLEEISMVVLQSHLQVVVVVLVAPIRLGTRAHVPISRIAAGRYEAPGLVRMHQPAHARPANK